MESPKELLRLVILGHVDHGKSTLIGRLLHDCGALPQGKIEQVRKTCEANSRPFEYAFLLDALKAEQSQGITIDAARVFFESKKRRYLLIDAPGHVEFLKNMITGAAHAEAAFLVIDAKEGVQENSRRHGYLASFLGIQKICVLVNKMDLVGYSASVFEAVTAEYGAFLKSIGVEATHFLPISALQGENVCGKSENLDWFRGPTALEAMDDLELKRRAGGDPFRMPVQDIYKFTRGGDDRRIVAGTPASGRAKVGDTLVFHPSGKKSVIRSIEAFPAADQAECMPGKPTGFTLTEQIFLSRGEVASLESELPPASASRFEANLFWLGKSPLSRAERFELKLGTARVQAELESIESAMSSSDLTAVFRPSEIRPAETAKCVIRCKAPIAFDLLSEDPGLRRFVVVQDARILGGGTIQKELERVNRPFTHAQPFVLWFTGLPGSGKSTLSRQVYEFLRTRNQRVEFLDGDELRRVFPGMGYSREERENHVRRTAHLASVLEKHGISTIASLISPYEESRKFARSLCKNFIEVYLSAPLAECEKRDPKGLFKKARSGEIRGFTGIDAPYEIPQTAELVLDTSKTTISQCVKEILGLL
ncbi:MAG: adenylyl-sulfate kinase [Bdellovibrionota bacterium]